MLRRLHSEQPESFAFTPANKAWADAQITKYPEGRQASAIIPLLWRAQEQEGWLSKPAIESVADMLDLPYIRALEVATFYFMFQLQPVGSVAHVQVCGTTSCMICGAEDLIGVCKEKISPKAHELSADGKFSWEEVECLGACANAPMVQIGKDFYEDLTAESFAGILDAFARGEVPRPGPQNGRFAAEPLGGLTSLKEMTTAGVTANGSVGLAEDIGDTIRRIDGSDDRIYTPWLGGKAAKSAPKAPAKTPATAKTQPAVEKAPKAPASGSGTQPAALKEAVGGKPDDLKKIKGIGPKLEKLCHKLGFYHFWQVARWTEDEVAWVDENLEGFKGRVTRDEWVAQAKMFVAEGKGAPAPDEI